MRNFVTMLFLLFTPMLFSQETRWNVKSFSADTGIATVEYNGTTYAGVCSYTSILSSPDYEVPPGGESQINDDGGFKSKTTHYSNNCQLDNGLLGRYKSCSTNAKHQDDAACVAHGENPSFASSPPCFGLRRFRAKRNPTAFGTHRAFTHALPPSFGLRSVPFTVPPCFFPLPLK